jgi:hypothetical protein
MRFKIVGFAALPLAAMIVSCSAMHETKNLRNISQVTQAELTPHTLIDGRVMNTVIGSQTEVLALASPKNPWGNGDNLLEQLSFPRHMEWHRSKSTLAGQTNDR